jgi:hypothetical protein
MVDALIASWNEATTESDRERVSRMATRTLHRAQHAPTAPRRYRERDTESWRREIALAARDRSLRDVASEFDVSQEQVRKLCKRFQVDRRV